MINLLILKTSNYDHNRINNKLFDKSYKDIIDNTICLSENDLDDYITNVINNIIRKYGGRGYGYWIWKPYIILQELNKLKDNDILIFVNAHVDFDTIAFDNIIKYLYSSDKPLIIASAGWNDYMYTTTKLKNVIEKYLNYKFSEDELNSFQYEAGIVFMKKCDFVINFYKQYFDIMINNIDAITDVYNDDKTNHSTFIENRHDQSVCSLLAKYYKINTLNLSWSDFHNIIK